MKGKRRAVKERIEGRGKGEGREGGMAVVREREGGLLLTHVGKSESLLSSALSRAQGS